MRLVRYLLALLTRITGCEVGGEGGAVGGSL